MKYYISASTDVGNYRDVNQDSCLVRKLRTKIGNMAFAVMCDGMGGLADGEVASSSVVNAFSEWFYRYLPTLSQSEIKESDIKAQWTSVAQSINDGIKMYGRQHQCMTGSTVTVLLLTDDKYYLLNIGDSRAYVVKEKVTQMTVDHTLVEREMRLGNMTPEQAAVSPMRSVLTRCVGVTEKVFPDFFFGKTQKNAVYFLCSDGFRHKITNDEIKDCFLQGVKEKEPQMKKREEYLIDLNKKRNESDNISVITIVTR